MIHFSKHILVIVFILLAGLGAGFSQDIPAPPDPPRLMIDETGMLSPAQVQDLENRLVAFDRSSSTQIVALMVPSLNGLTIEEYADRIGEEWGVGQKGKDNGIVVVIKPKIGSERGRARISVGYGLEEVVNDAVANRIVDRIMIPYFKENRYYEGLSEGVNVLIDLSNGVYTSEGVRKVQQRDVSYFPFFIVIFFIIISLIWRRKSRRYYSTGRGSGTGGFLTGMLLGSMMSHRGSSGSWGNFSSGSGSFGGGGGFGGFGGGSFGGGGASGSW
jgi:uncharacterized protein